LGVAKGCEHSAEICGDILHNEGERHIFFLTRRGKDKITEGQEGQQRHIVSDQHRTDKGYVNERENADLCGLEALNDLAREHIEEIDILQGTNNRKDAEKASQRFVVKITCIFGIGRNYNRGDNSRTKRDKDDGILFYKRNYFKVGQMVMMGTLCVR
jgi:hypothetical protein